MAGLEEGFERQREQRLEVPAAEAREQAGADGRVDESGVDVEFGAARELHRKYAIDAVPIVAVTHGAGLPL